MKTGVSEPEKKIRPKGGRPPKAVIRNDLLAVRLLPDEKKVILEKAKTARLTPSEWFRKAAMKGKVVPRLSAEEAHYLRVLAGLANNLNQLTKLAHSKGLPNFIKVLIGLLEKVDDVIKKLLGDDR